MTKYKGVQEQWGEKTFEMSGYSEILSPCSHERKLLSRCTGRWVSGKSTYQTQGQSTGVTTEGSIYVPLRQYARHERPCAYANISAKILITGACTLFLTLAAFVAPATSQTTVTYDLPSGCMFLQSSPLRMDKVLDDSHLILAWHRLWQNKEDHVVRAYSCKTARLAVVPKLTTTAEAIYLDDNVISAVKEADLVPNPGNVSRPAPTLAVSLSGNRISLIESGAFRYLPKLRLLILRNNSLEDLGWTISSYPIFQSLVELDLSMNGIESIASQSFGSFPYLERLDLSGNGIRTVDGTVLSKLPKLEYLDLSSNRVAGTSLTPSDLPIRSLRFLSLADNILGELRTSHVAEFWKKLPNLTTLDISMNQITCGAVHREAFYGLSSLSTLNLSACGIKTLDQGWLSQGPKGSLHLLDLSHNLFESISASNFVLDGNLRRNKTEKAKESGYFSAEHEEDRKGIEVLFLNGNHRLTTVEDDTFETMPSLKLLFLQNCALRRLNVASARYRYGPDPIATTLPMLTNVWIFGNPLSCDCYIRFLKEWSMSTSPIQQGSFARRRSIDSPIYTLNSQTRTISTEFSICVGPETLAGVAVEAAPGKSMTCQEEPYSVLVAMLIGPLTFAGSVVLTILCGSLHVFIARMKKGTVLSYHAREELMRNPKGRKRGRGTPQPILSNIGWRHSHDDLSTYSTGSRSGRHTNLVLGNFEEHHHRREATNRPRNKLSPEMHLVTPTVSFNADEHRAHSRTHSAGYCSGTEMAKGEINKPQLSHRVGSDARQHDQGSGSDADSVLDRESVRTRSPSTDIPFIDEKDRGETDKRSLGRSSSYTSSNSGGACSLSRGADHELLCSRKPGDELRLRKMKTHLPPDGGQNSSHKIPGISTSDQASSDETSL